MFNKKSTAEDVTKGLDLSGLNVLVTGVNSGLGYETMRVLAERGAHVIGAARTREKAQEACNSVQGKTTPAACELSDMDAVANCAQEINALDIPIDRIICNAGIMALPKLQVKNGLELQFLTNHMGHFLLLYLLQDAVKRAKNARIVLLSSAAHQFTVKGGINFHNLDGSQGYNAWQFYGQSKLANLLTANAFNERLSEHGVTVNAVHPGVIKTNLGRDLGGLIGGVMSLPFFGKLLEWTGGKSISQGAATQCFVASHSAVRGIGGRYFSDCKEARPSWHGRNDALAERLWQYSVDYLSDYVAPENAYNKHVLTDLTDA